MDMYPGAIAGIEEDWETIWEFFDDPENFPDGATVVVNTQYNPFDDCTESYSGIALTPLKIMLLADYNTVIGDMTAEHANGALADQYTNFLGHGHLFDNSACPHYDASAEYWMSDLIHANSTGHVEGLAVVFEGVADSLYGECE